VKETHHTKKKKKISKLEKGGGPKKTPQAGRKKKILQRGECVTKGGPFVGERDGYKTEKPSPGALKNSEC